MLKDTKGYGSIQQIIQQHKNEVILCATGWIILKKIALSEKKKRQMKKITYCTIPII